MRLYMMRHGETDWNKKHLWQGKTDIPLNEKGRYVAELTREGLKDIHIDIAFCSPLCRAKETAEIVLRDRDVQLIEDERIIEMGFGPFEGRDMREVTDETRVFFMHPEQYVVPEGAEGFDEVLNREKSFLDELIGNPEYQDYNILIATHGAALRGLLAVLESKPVERYWEGGVHKNCGMSIVDIKGGKINILQEAIILYDEKDLKSFAG